MSKPWGILDPEQEQEIVAAVRASAGLGKTYLTLLILSSFISIFGLLANSTATVIGAMIVAPLMGPILGIALALVQGDLGQFRRALLAEVVGVLACLTLASLTAIALGPDQIDFGQGEIAGRVRPTLLDLVVGFAAGLAGAFCTVHRRASASFAGVAIAVALVPPLCVSGLCLGGTHFSASMGAFVLFGANFLTIQLAAMIVFAAVGLGHWSQLRREPRLLPALALNLLLLMATGWFLWRQLGTLVTERRAEKQTRGIVLRALGRISGANLDSLKVQLGGGRLEIEVLARAPDELNVSFARDLEHELRNSLEFPIDLRIGTALASYVTAQGRLFAPEKPDPTPKEMLLEETRRALEKSLLQFPGVELVRFHQVSSTPQGQRLRVAVQSPYLFDSSRVRLWQAQALKQIQERFPTQTELTLTVRTTLIQDYSASGRESVAPAEILSDQELRARDWQQKVTQAFSRLLSVKPGEATLKEVRITVHPESKENREWLEVNVRILVAHPVPDKVVVTWSKRLAEDLSIPLDLEVEFEFGRTVTIPRTGSENKPEGSKHQPLPNHP